MPAQTTNQTEPEKNLFVWKAVSRPFKRRNREFYLTLISMAAIVCLVIFFAEGWMPVVLIVSLVFLFYILNTVEPEIIEYKITNKGIRVAASLNEWQFLNRFWFSRRYDNKLLIFETVRIPGRIELVIEEKDKTKLREILKEYLTEEEASPTFADKSANWIAKKLPQG